MKSSRHPHPHVDPRQPRRGTQVTTNPPVFVWKPPKDIQTSTLEVAGDEAFTNLQLRVEDLHDPLYLPETPLPIGNYFWRWTAGDLVSETFEFEVTEKAVELEVPGVDVWLKRLGTEHPRIYLGPERQTEIRNALSGDYAEVWEELQDLADKILTEPHEIEEPPYLPNRQREYAAFRAAFSKAMWESRGFVGGAQTLALAYVFSGERKYARAACERMASISQWDPYGSTHLAHNDEPHMSVIWNGPAACDWIWDEFTEEERERVINQFRQRGQITFEHMHGRGAYGVTRFDSHAGREIVFLAMTAMVFHDHIPEADQWLDWLRPVLCGIWPVWSGDDGAWSEGISYGLAYVRIMTIFATALKQGTGIDLYRKPFWRGHAEWRRWCFPAYAEWIGFGDHCERWRNTWNANGELVEIIARETGAEKEFAAYLAQFREEAKLCEVRAVHRGHDACNPQKALFPTVPGSEAQKSDSVLRCFPGAGWASFRRDLAEPARDIAMIFRSSPFGSLSHSHANQNDFILHAGGKVLAMPSGYYAGYGSPHHANWVWHTKSHNCLTLSGAGQIMRSANSSGELRNAFEDDNLAFVSGNADAAYSPFATACRRHVLYLKKECCFLMVDEFVAQPGITTAPEWNLHSWAKFSTDEKERSFSLEREGARLNGFFLFHNNSFFTQTEGWEPPPLPPLNPQWLNQYHLRFTPATLFSRLNLGVILQPQAPGIATVEVHTEIDGDVETAQVGQTSIQLARFGSLPDQGEAFVQITVAGTSYQLGSNGLCKK